MALWIRAPWTIRYVAVLFVYIFGLLVTIKALALAESTAEVTAFRNAGNKSTSNMANIYGGINALPGQFPFMAGIYANNNFSCGSSILAPTWVVTAAHCLVTPDDTVGSTKAFFRTPISQISIGVGSISNATAKMNTVKRIVVSPMYNANNNTHDLALIELNTPLTYSSDVGPVRISTTLIRTHETLTALGWGYTQNKSIATTLQTVNLTTTTDDNCRKGFPTWDGQDGDLICTGETPGKDTCYGDSGGPLVKESIPGTGLYVLVGLTSFGIDLNNAVSTECAQAGGIGYYTNLSRYAAWISSTIGVSMSDLTSSAMTPVARGITGGFRIIWTSLISALVIGLSM